MCPVHLAPAGPGSGLEKSGLSKLTMHEIIPWLKLKGVAWENNRELAKFSSDRTGSSEGSLWRLLSFLTEAEDESRHPGWSVSKCCIGQSERQRLDVGSDWMCSPGG